MDSCGITIAEIKNVQSTGTMSPNEGRFFSDEETRAFFFLEEEKVNMLHEILNCFWRGCRVKNKKIYENWENNLMAKKSAS